MTGHDALGGAQPDQGGPAVREPALESGRPAGALAPADVAAVRQRINAPFDVEIGMGSGHFLVEHARRNPERFIVGVERKRFRVVRALKKIETSGITNAAVVMGGAEVVLDLLPTSAVAAFHIYFLDPWPKSRHRKRRFLRKDTVSLLLDRLEPGGRVLFATDMLDYFMQARILFILCGAVSVDAEPPEESHLSVYSTRFRKSGTRTYFAVARKPWSPPSRDAAISVGRP